jgi:outer membrane protein assembly factor BamE
MRVFLIILAAFSLSACQLIYKLPTRQGNVIEQKQLDQLKVGMTREQVKFLLGTPIAASPFESQRWDYVGYYKSPRGKVSNRVVSLYFDQNTLARMEGTEAPKQDAALDSPDVQTVIEQEKKAETEKTREESEQNRESGVTLTPEPQP